jgi:hypothetical protein
MSTNHTPTPGEGDCPLQLTFLQFFCSHDFIASNKDTVSGDSKNLVLGPPSFFGAKDIILLPFYMTLRLQIDQITAEALTTLVQEHAVPSVGKSCTQQFLITQQSGSVLPPQIIYVYYRRKLPHLGDISISCYRHKYCINFTKLSVIPSDSSGYMYTTQLVPDNCIVQRVNIYTHT